jgi:DNA-binding protein HU-beta
MRTELLAATPAGDLSLGAGEFSVSTPSATALTAIRALRTVGAERRFQHSNPYNPTERGAKEMMTKSQIVAHLAEKVGIPKKIAAAVLVELVTVATKEAKSSGQFVVPGLGKAVKANRKARMGRNPQTGEAIKIAAKTVVKFRLAKAFKEAVVPPKKK